MKTILLLFGVIITSSCFAQKQIKLQELKDHIGDSVKVQGFISGVKYLENAKDAPTFISVGGVYPNQLLTIVIWGDVRGRLQYIPTEEKDKGNAARVTGKVELFKGKPQIVINDPVQLEIIVDRIEPDK